MVEMSCRHYLGRSSLGLPMRAQTQRVDAGIELLALPFGFKLACEDGSESEGAFHEIIESPTLMPPGRLDLDLPFPFGPG